MSATREQEALRQTVADLREGDVVEMSWAEAGANVSVRGPLRLLSRGVLAVGSYWVREDDGSPIQALGPGGTRTLTVVSSAPRPLYVNHDRTEPVPGDVVRDADSNDRTVWVREDWSEPIAWWKPGNGACACRRENLPDRLRLLVDGSTGQVVP